MNVSGLYKRFLFITGFFFLTLEGFNQTPSQAYGLQFSSHEAVPEEPGRHREKSIAIANAIFQFDELNEHALRIKCKTLIALGRHTLAKTTYDKFSSKYKEIYGEEFAENYQAIIHA
jgi:hypothetical protein